MQNNKVFIECMKSQTLNNSPKRRTKQIEASKRI